VAGLSPDLVAEVGAFVRRERLLDGREPVVALVSGGGDSTLLVHVLAALGRPLELLHVAHGLRGAESRADAEFCVELGAGLGATCTVVEAPIADGAGVEARARDARRAAADRVAAGRRRATGHTRDDRVETILYRLAASPGRAAWRALPATDGEGRVRPLLCLTRERVRAELFAAGIGWREDASNADRRFARNRVRHDVLPGFRSLHPAAERNLLETAAALRDEEEALAAAASDLFCENGTALDVERASAAHPALVRHALRLLAGRPTPPRDCLERAVALCGSTAGTALAPLGGGRVERRRRTRLRVERPA
jgi:tRNA(Ile)-lysidine synthase